MCQLHSPILTNNLLKRCKGKRLVKMYKIFKIEGNNLISPYKFKQYSKNRIEYRISKESIKRKMVGDEISYGFHCFDSLKIANRVIKKVNFFKDKILVEINVKPKDIFSKGQLTKFVPDKKFEKENPSTVISAFSIPKSEWKRIFK